MDDQGQEPRRASDRVDPAGTDEAVIRERDKAYAEIRELQQRLAEARRQWRKERAERERLAKQRKSRMIRLVREAARAGVELNRGLRGRLRARDRRHAATGLSGSQSEAGAANPFFARIDSLDIQIPNAPEDLWVGETGTAPAAAYSPLVSVVMVVSDATGSVEECVESVLQQSYTPWELIVRDCRRRGWLEPAIGADDDRISSAWVRSSSEGVARNSGLAAARGELIAYLDPPNLWHPRFLETLVAAVIGNCTRYLVYCDHLDAASPAVPSEEVSPGQVGEADYAQLVADGVITLNAVVHRRELYDEIGGAKEGRIGHDRDLLLKYAFVRDPLKINARLLLQQHTVGRHWSAASSVPQPSVASLRASAEAYFRDELPRPIANDRPTLTVVDGVGELAHAKAWDLAAVAGEVTSSQLVSFLVGETATCGHRLLPAPETETIRLEGGDFPRWASGLARGVANVHGDVVYAAEPRLPSLGLALLASYHHGASVLADLSAAPAIENPPIDLCEVDPSDPALLDPHSPLWDRVMAGVAQALPSCVVGSLAAAQETASNSLVLHHPKDEATFDPSLHDPELARRRLGLPPNEPVLLCGAQSTASQGVADRPELMDGLASRFRLLILGVDRSGDHHGGARSSLDPCPQVVDRADESRLAAALVASDALLLWHDPQAPAHGHDAAPELVSALAMRVPVIANNLEGLAPLGLSERVCFVPYGDVDGVARCLDAARRDHHRWQAQLAGGRHLFMRQFSYAAARVNLSMILRLVHHDDDTLQPATEFAEFFSAFYRHADAVRGSEQ